MRDDLSKLCCECLMLSIIQMKLISEEDDTMRQQGLPDEIQLIHLHFSGKKDSSNLGACDSRDWQNLAIAVCQRSLLHAQTLWKNEGELSNTRCCCIGSKAL